MKWRVITNHKDVYKPQYRFLWWWCDVHPHPEHNIPLTFKTMPEARAWVHRQIKPERWDVAEKYYD